MKINLPRITRALALTDYAPEMVDAEGKPLTVHVWVNPPRAMMREHTELTLNAIELREALGKPEQAAEAVATRVAQAGNALAGWYAEAWSQHTDAATHWTMEEVLALGAEEPALYRWLTRRTIELIDAQRDAAKKN